MTRAPLQPTCAQRTDSVSFLQFFPWSLALQTAYLARAWSVRGPCVVRAWSVRGPCLLRTSQVQLSNEQTELTWTVPSKHVLRTYNALIWRAGHVLTTCATVRLTCIYILPLCSCHSLTTFSEKNVAGLASPKNVRKKNRRMGCARGLTEHTVVCSILYVMIYSTNHIYLHRFSRL